MLYVEEPVFADDLRRASLDISLPSTGVHRVVPRLPGAARESYDALAVVRALLLGLVGEGGPLAGRFDDAIQWFYTPMPARTMLGAFGECAVVYDCMDELSQFRFAPPDLTSRERLLMACADIVFTGGHQLHASKARYHDNVHFFGCGVDADHFARARSEETVVATELAGLPRPVLGYFGVVDERLDYELIDRLAAAFSHGSVVFVGPLAKVDAHELPRQPNLHWLGQRAYEALPEHVKGFDVCLMPFALNEATEYINPTKTLEYMAAGKPIVSTAVPDVVRNFAPIVRVAHSIDSFIDQAAEAVASDVAHADRIEAGIARARASSWESIVSAMDRLMVAAISDRAGERMEAARARSARRSTAAVDSPGKAANAGSAGEGTTNAA